MVSEAPIVPIGATIPAAWAWHRLDSICEGIFDCPHSTPKLTDVGPFVVRTQDVRTGTFRTDQAARVSEDTYRERIVRAEPRPGDLVFSREGTYFGHAAEVPVGVRVCLGQRMVLIRPSPRKVNSTFLRFWINSPFMAAYVAGFRDGSVAERLNLPTIRALPVGMPPLAEQGAIARVLRALDDKIELNRRTNATLEAIARALFKSWFVDKPSADWPTTTLAHYADLNPESWSRATYPEEVRYVDLSGTKWGAIESTARFARKDAPSRAQRILRWGDTIVGTVRPGNGSFALVASKGLTGSTGFAVLRPRSRDARTFVYCAATSTDNIDRLAHLADGGAYPAVRAELVSDTEVAEVPEEVLRRFEANTANLMDRIASNRAESETLARLRDALLPRLLSGELSVAEVEATQ